MRAWVWPILLVGACGGTEDRIARSSSPEPGGDATTAPAGDASIAPGADAFATPSADASTIGADASTTADGPWRAPIDAGDGQTSPDVRDASRDPDAGPCDPDAPPTYQQAYDCTGYTDPAEAECCRGHGTLRECVGGSWVTTETHCDWVPNPPDAGTDAGGASDAGVDAAASDAARDPTRGEVCVTDDDCAPLGCAFPGLCGENCTPVDSCGAGRVCFVPGDFAGACLDACTSCGSSDECAPGHVCTIGLGNPVLACLSAAHPMATRPCP